MVAVAAPPLDADDAILADWLELTAFHDAQSRARFDVIDNVFKIQDEENASDTGDADALRETRRARIETEIALRGDRLADAYPFTLSEDGEELTIKIKGQRRLSSFYLFCLVFSHASRSPILLQPPASRLLARGRRREFQILATLAVAGYIDGPSLSFGWPRASGTTILQAVARACALSGVGTPRAVPGPVASKYAKDGGMDVIAWRPAIDGFPPPAEFCFGQAASGHGWRTKNAPDEVEDFYRSYYFDRPNCQTTGVTVVPHRLTTADHDVHGHRHGHILDRLRTPRAAIKGYDLAAAGVTVDEVPATAAIAVWLGRYRSQVSKAA